MNYKKKFFFKKKKKKNKQNKQKKKELKSYLPTSSNFRPDAVITVRSFLITVATNIYLI